MNKIVIDSIITGIRSKVDGSIGMNISTPSLSPKEKTLFFELQGVNLLLEITPKDEREAPEIKIDKEAEQKTPSQRLRGSLFRVWETMTDQSTPFEQYYLTRMSQIIESVKGEIV
jgi:hypothetical protein